MTTPLLLATVVAAGAFCPLMMWIQGRRGRAAACCRSSRDREHSATLDELRRRRAEVDALLAERDGGQSFTQARSGS